MKYLEHQNIRGFVDFKSLRCGDDIRDKILFAYEARFGRINRPRPCWAQIGITPEVASQLIRKYIYLYGAVSPRDGTCVYLIMPRSDTACFQVFLNALSRKFARQDILLVLDGAPNHRCRDAISRCSSCRPIRQSSTRRKISGRKSAKKSSRTTPSNQSTPFAPSSSRLYIERNPTMVKSITTFPISPSHSDVEMVLHGATSAVALKQKLKERVMNRQRRIFTATLALISLIGEISSFSPAAAASHYPLWVCAGRYGGWGWSRPAGLFGNLTLDTLASALANPHGYEYRYPAYSDVSFYYAYPDSYCVVSYTNGSGYSARLRKSNTHH